MQLYTPDNNLLLDIEVDDSSYGFKEIMGANTLKLNFSLPEYVPIAEGAYCDFNAERYFMPASVGYAKEHSQKFVYTLQLEGSICFFKATKFKFFDYILNNGAVEPTSSFKLKFSITATPRMIADLLIANLKLKYPQYPWAVGDCIESEPVLFDFNHAFCFDVFTEIVNKFKTEWELDKYTLNIGNVEKMKDSAIDLSYGYDNGILGGIERTQFDNSRIINRVYVDGGDRNIDSSTYKNDTLLLLKDTIITHEGIDYKTDPSGSYIERVEPLAGEDDSLDISKFYPKRVGTVSQVIVVDDAQGLYDIIDADIPESLDFSKKIIAGETMTVIFQTGQLAGKEFDVEYKHSTRKFELKPINDKGLVYPQGNIIPEIGDTYAVFHMRMPEEYITAAETDALQEAVKHLAQKEQPQYSYRWLLDSIYAKRNWGEIRGYLNIGFFIRFSDPQFLPVAVSVRIVSVKVPVNDPRSPEITISNNISGNSPRAAINAIPNTVQAADRKDSDVVAFTKRGFRQAQETMRMLIESGLAGFSDAIQPIIVQTMGILVGSPQLQFYFVDNKTEANRIASGIAYNKDDKRLVCPLGLMQHRTLGISGNDLTHHTPDKYKYWQTLAYQSDVLTDADKSYYLYLRCEVDDDTDGRYLLSEKSIPIDQTEGFYHFLVGILNSEDEAGDRSFVELFGMTEILPSHINTNKIMSADGNNVIDLLTGVFSIGDTNSRLEWNVVPHLLKLLNASFEIKNSNGDTIASIDGDTGAALFCKGNVKFSADGSTSIDNENSKIRFLFDTDTGRLSITYKGMFSNIEGFFGVPDGLVEPELRFKTQDRITRFKSGLLNITGLGSWGVYDTILTMGNNWIGEGLHLRGQKPNASHFGDTRNNFLVAVNTAELIVWMDNLPTSPVNKSTGQVWNDNGTLKIVQ